MTRVTMNVYSMTNVRNAMRNIPMSLNTEIAVKKVGRRGCFDTFQVELKNRHSTGSMDAFRAFRSIYTGKIDNATLWTTPRHSRLINLEAIN